MLPWLWLRCPFKKPRSEQDSWPIYRTHWVKRWEFWLWPRPHGAVLKRLWLLVLVSQDTSVIKHLLWKVPCGNIYPVISGEHWFIIIWMNTVWSLIVMMKDYERYWVCGRKFIWYMPHLSQYTVLKKKKASVSVWGKLQIGGGTIGTLGSPRKSSVEFGGPTSLRLKSQTFFCCCYLDIQIYRWHLFSSYCSFHIEVWIKLIIWM